MPARETLTVAQRSAPIRYSRPQTLPKGLSLNPADAIHLSTAARNQCDDILTCDAKWAAYAGLVKRIRELVIAAGVLEHGGGFCQNHLRSGKTDDGRNVCVKPDRSSFIDRAPATCNRWLEVAA